MVAQHPGGIARRNGNRAALTPLALPGCAAETVWNNLYPNRQPNPDTRHSGEPVTSGQKFIITKWFREFGAGKMYLEWLAAGRQQ